MNKTLLALAAAPMILSPQVFAAQVKVTGSIPTVVEQSGSITHGRQLLKAQPKVVMLQKVALSSLAKKQIAKWANQSLQHPTYQNQTGENVQLGMGNVPVLDQGAHGSCVTFANSGAIDAALNAGDYVSELCSLALGKQLAKEDPNYPDGWNGSWGPIVLAQMMEYGVVSMDNQHNYSCGGLKEYPVFDPFETGHAMSVNSYKNLSESLENRVEWQPLLNVDEAFDASKYSPEQVLEQVKQSLRDGNRVSFGVLLDVDQGHNGALGSHKARYDTWMLTPEIAEDAEYGEIQAGHEMVITGFDDDAVVTAPDGTSNKGLLTLRNSWGTFSGDHGNYYMSYDHFKSLTLEAQIVKASHN